MSYLQLIIIICIYLSPIINVLFTIPLLIISLIKINKFSPFIIASTFALLSVFLKIPVDWDLSRHFELYSTYQNGVSTTDVPYIGLHFVFSILSLFNLSYHAIPFLFSFILYFYLSKIYLLSIEDKNNSFLYNSVILFSFLLSVPIILFTGLRFSTGIILFIYGVVINSNSKIKSNFYLLFSLIFHYSLLVPIILWFICILLSKYKIRKNTVFFLSALSLVISYYIAPILELAYSLIDGAISHYYNNISSLNYYLSGKWGLGYIEQLNSSGLLIFNLRLYFFILIGFLFIHSINKKKIDNITILFSCFITILCFILSSFSELFVRYSYIAIIIIYYCSLKYESNINNKVKIINLLIPIYIIYQQSYYGFFAMRYVFCDSFSNLTLLKYSSL